MQTFKQLYQKSLLYPWLPNIAHAKYITIGSLSMTIKILWKTQSMCAKYFTLAYQES